MQLALRVIRQGYAGLRSCARTDIYAELLQLLYALKIVFHSLLSCTRLPAVRNRACRHSRAAEAARTGIERSKCRTCAPLAPEPSLVIRCAAE